MPDTDTDTDTDVDGGTDGDPPHDRAREGLEHLQTAARELIQAARAMLDVAEDLVNDPEAAASMVGAVGALGDLVRDRVGGERLRRHPGPGTGADDGADDSGDDSGDDDVGVERIPVL
jgi:hypothetical protein